MAKTGLLGVDTANVNSDITKAGGGGHGLLEQWEDGAGGKWIFVKASTAFTLGDTVWIKPSGAGTPITFAAAAKPGRIGFAQVAFTVDYYGWVKTEGAVTLRGGASCNANVPLYTSATAGVLDDATLSTSAFQIDGVVASQSASGAGETMTGFASYPMVKKPTTSA